MMVLDGERNTFVYKVHPLSNSMEAIIGKHCVFVQHEEGKFKTLFNMK